MTSLDWKQVAMFGIFLTAVVVLGVAHVIDAHALSAAMGAAGGFLIGWIAPTPIGKRSIPPPPPSSEVH